MNGTTKILAVLAVVLSACLAALAWHLWPALQAPKHIEAGTKTGEQVPVDLALKDSTGLAVTIADVAGPNGTVLLLVRSADWCPFCKLQLMDHSAIADQIEARGYSLVSLSYDEPSILADFATDLDQPFVMLSDPESRFIDAVGLRDPHYGPGHFAHGVPRASVLVIASEGTIKAKLVSADYRQRPSNEFVLSMLDKAEK